MIPNIGFAFGAKRSHEYPCPSIHIVREDLVNLTETEIRLLCGDLDQQRVGKAWRDIPLAQAKTSFRNFLQDRGYFSPRFEEESSGVLVLDPGEITRITRLFAIDFPNRVRLDRYRGPIGQAMTPERISTIRDWAKKRLQEEGYPCPEIQARAFPGTGEIQVTWLNPSASAQVSSIVESGRPGLKLGIIRRYDAFEVGDAYSLVTTEISGRRSSESKLTLSHDLDPKCMIGPSTKSAAFIDLLESTQSGPPRLITLGLGANTETGLGAHASWSHTRLGANGSSALFSLKSTFKDQSALARGEWFYSPTPTRQHLSPFAQFAHVNERRYETLALRTQMIWQTGRDISFGQWSLGIGPSWQNIQQLNGVGPLNSRYLAVKTALSFESHLFEYYSASPREGYQASLSTQSVASPLTGAGYPHSLQLDAIGLWHPGGYDPPFAILGLRGRLFWSPVQSGVQIRDLPVDFRRWVGGGQDVRGFGRQELPDNDFGARLALTLGSEIRIPHLLPVDLQPFILLDAAWIRSGPITGEEITRGFWSPGFGLRWGSPVGPLRASLAHGYEIARTDTSLSHWQFYLSLGEEF